MKTFVFSSGVLFFALWAGPWGQTPPPESTSPPAAQFRWRKPPMTMKMPMLPGLMDAVPGVSSFLPGIGKDPRAFPMAVPRRVVALQDGDTMKLQAQIVRRRIRGRTFVMYGFNGQFPGPLIQVKQNATITVDFTNRIDLPTTVHWHGVRIENRYDGAPGVTQKPVMPGESFVYKIHFRDAGIYWYHPHYREDIQQDLGLYGNMLVRSPKKGYYSPVNREEFLMLDDILLDDQGLFPFGREAASHSFMGRFGNVLLVNGEPQYTLNLKKGDLVRFFLTNVSNTRTFNLSFGGLPIKVVGADLGNFEHEEWVKSVIIAPAQRYIIEVGYPQKGTFQLMNKVQGLDHFAGQFYPQVDLLGSVRVSAEATQSDHSATYRILREYSDVVAEVNRYRRFFQRPVDHRLTLTVRAGQLPSSVAQFMAMDTTYFPPVEWNDSMTMMNYVSTSKEVTWILLDPDTGKQNMDIHWDFRVGEVARIELYNDFKSFHPMQHPIHFHGQRFLVIAKDGIPNRNLVWKDTVVIPVGSRVDILLEASNPGKWMAHCHIAEHLESGMKMVFTVRANSNQ